MHSHHGDGLAGSSSPCAPSQCWGGMQMQDSPTSATNQTLVRACAALPSAHTLLLRHVLLRHASAGPLCIHAFGVRTSGWAARSRAIRVYLRHGQATCPRPSTWSLTDLKSCWSRLRNCARDAPHEALCSQAPVLGQDQVQKWWCGGVSPEATVLDDRLCLQPGHICKPCKPRLSGAHRTRIANSVSSSKYVCRVVQACRMSMCMSLAAPLMTTAL